jgi:hypothetical protein
MRTFLSLLDLFFVFLSCFNNAALVLTFLPFLQLQGTADAHDLPPERTGASGAELFHEAQLAAAIRL